MAAGGGRGATMLLWTCQTIKVFAVAVPIVKTFTDLVGDASWVEGRSMQPTLNADIDSPGGGRDLVWEDKLYGNMYGKDTRDFSRGDVVTITSPYDPSVRMVKRLVGLPGDAIRPRPQLKAAEGPRGLTRGWRAAQMIRIVPKGHCWVEGDNADVSEDSNVFGEIPMALIECRVSHILWPPHRAGALAREPQQEEGKGSKGIGSSRRRKSSSRSGGGGGGGKPRNRSTVVT